MKAVLVAMNAKYIHSNLGIYSIQAYAREHGVTPEELEIVEYTINQELEWVLSDLYEKQPDLVAFSCYIWNIEQIKTLAAHFHKIKPEVPIWFGGPEVSFDAPSLLADYEWLSGIMCGEGEATFLELFQVTADHWPVNAHFSMYAECLSQVAGIVYRSEHQIITTQERPRLSMDELAFPYQDMKDLEHRIVYYETSRGCPFGCSYCLSSVEKKVRFRSMELVEQELQFFLEHQIPQVKFVDRTFNCHPEHTMAIWRYIQEHDNGITNFHFEMSADLLTQEQIAYIKSFRPGLVQFEIGVQTTNPQTIEAITRKSDLLSLESKVASVHAGRNIHQHLDLIAGLPYEDYDSFRHSFNDVYQMRPDQLQLGFLKVLKGSPIHQQREQYGIVYMDIPPYEVMYTKWLSYEEILRLKQVEDMVERYYNSMQFQASMSWIVDQFETPFDFFQALGNFYHTRGYEGLHQSRLQNYQILREFYQGTFGPSALLDEMLYFDLYARENLKNRPSFLALLSGETKEQKVWKREFYQSEEMRSQYLSDYTEYDWKQTMRMTHVAFFDYDILGYCQNGDLQKIKTTVLFDYKQRDPLSYQAHMEKIK